MDQTESMIVSTSPDSFSLVFADLLLLMAVHDDNGHDEETKVAQYDNYYWGNK